MDVYIVFGVSGVGKSTIGKLLADELGIGHYDADDYHPQSNVDKMSQGQALNDEDRLPWLNTLADEIGQWSVKGGAVLSCSALKEKYRELLSSQYAGIKWVFLQGDRDLIAARMSKRQGHFFSEALLDTQFAALEEPTYGCKVSIENKPEEIIQIILNHPFQ